MICDLCFRNCNLKESDIGFCGSRQNQSEKNVTNCYGYVSWTLVHKIELLQLYHFYPNLTTYSIGGYGCNLKCRWCINREISTLFELNQADQMTIKELFMDIKKSYAKGIAFRFNEPFMNYEFMMDVFQNAQSLGLKTISKTALCVDTAFFKRILSSNLIDAFNVDVKGTKKFYKDNFNFDDSILWDNMIQILEEKKHLEISTSLIPRQNKPEDIEKISIEIAKRLSRNTPFHIRQFYPSNYYLANKNEDLKKEFREKAFILAKKHLNFVYIQSFSDISYNTTICPICGGVIVERISDYVRNINNEKDCCRKYVIS